MVAGPLVDLHVKAGEDLIRLLDEAGADTRSALWTRENEQDDWRLMLATSTAAQEGLRAAYEEVLTVFRAHEQDLQPLQADDIVVVEPTHPVLMLYSKIASTGPTIGLIRSIGNTVNGQLLPDSLLYRVQPPKAA